MKDEKKKKPTNQIKFPDDVFELINELNAQDIKDLGQFVSKPKTIKMHLSNKRVKI